MIRRELTAEAGRAFALVGDWRLAVSCLEQGLAALGADYPRDRVLYLTYLAEAYLAGDEVDGARSYAARAAALAAGLRSARVAAPLDALTHRVPAGGRPERRPGGAERGGSPRRPRGPAGGGGCVLR